MRDESIVDSIAAPYMRPRIKFCGMTRAEDVSYAASLGVDALGFILYPKSKRALTLEQAQALLSTVPFGVSSVVLVVNAAKAEVETVIQRLRPSYIQFHGDETPEFCEQFGYPYVRAIRVGGPGLSDATAVAAEVQRYPHASAFIFDAYSPAYGGAGITFDLQLLEQVKQQLPPHKLIIAGGLTPDNIHDVVMQQQPFGVDLCSGIEAAAGQKDRVLMRRFVEASYGASPR